MQLLLPYNKCTAFIYKLLALIHIMCLYVPCDLNVHGFNIFAETS